MKRLLPLIIFILLALLLGFGLKNADQKSLLGITIDMNRLATDARNNKLSPDDIAGGI